MKAAHIDFWNICLNLSLVKKWKNSLEIIDGRVENTSLNLLSSGFRNCVMLSVPAIVGQLCFGNPVDGRT